KKAGMNLTLKSLDKDDYSTRKKQVNYTITTTGKSMEGDPDSYLFGEYSSKSKANKAGAKDPALDKMLDMQRQEPDVTRRRQLIRDAVKYINENAFGL